VLRYQAAQGLSDSRTGDINRRLLSGILPQRGWDMDLRHA
jgi:hypothetical protein